MSFVERLKFRDVLGVGLIGAVLYGLYYVPIDDIVKGALIAGLTLVVQFYFRKKDEAK